ncbi:MAG: hypothetical protein F6K40_06980 [Okeania sp. SIO3I5]|uniref:hypothetical protein n=1 Tax=Okeania sp. SIO3I5 TaxID=2607805 RepID=UPI0013BBEF8C|nr:hypothetical protein [Okeania sp. SIO3I5]NEQ36041.1 hypothetical protein [Okeania sp. SIO3I5]
MIANVMKNFSESNYSPPPNYISGKQLQVPRPQQREGHIPPVRQLKAPPRLGFPTVGVVQTKTNELTYLAQQSSKSENYSTGKVANPIIQRVIEGDDPLSQGILEPEHKNDLLYGLAGYRGTTIKRIKDKAEEDSIPGIESRKMTIDEYNQALGLDIVGVSPILGVYSVRQALENPEKWKDYLPASKITYPKKEDGADISNEQKWMKFLVANSQKIGLWDLGDSTPEGRRFFQLLPGKATGLNLIKSKKRFEKNIDENFNKKLTEKLVHKLLSYGTDYDTALNKFTKLNKENNPLAQDVNKWVQNAFWRRTSKLGIDFATTMESGLDARVHFNLTSGRQNDTGGWEPDPKGIIKDVEEDRGKRKITESEWRYAQKLIKNDPSLKERILEYSEYE